MRVAVLTLAAADFEAIVAHCLRELPNEACGVLGGRDGRVECVYPVKSAYPSPSRFAMDPTAQLRALEDIDCAGRELVGIYHSHPQGPAAPSRVDVEGTCWPGSWLPNYPGTLQLIVSLQAPAAPVLKAYAPAAGAFIEVPIVISQ